MVSVFLICFAISIVLLLLAAWTAARAPERRSILLVLAAGLLCVHATVYLPGTVDDSYIAYRFARNWASGLGPVFQAGERVEGYTSFAWMTLLALGARLQIDINLLAKILGVIFASSALVPAYLLAERLTSSRRCASVAPLMLAVSPLYAAWVFAGMDAPLFAAAMAWAAWGLAREDHRRPAFSWTAVLLGFSLWIRPEGFLFIAAGFLAQLAPEGHVAGIESLARRSIARAGASRSRKAAPDAQPRVTSGASRIVAALRWLATAAAVAGPYWLWRWSYYGQFFPNTFYAKTRLGLERALPGMVTVWDFVGYAGLAVIGLALLGLSRVRGPAARFMSVSLAGFLI